MRQETRDHTRETRDKRTHASDKIQVTTRVRKETREHTRETNDKRTHASDKRQETSEQHTPWTLRSE